MKTYEKIIVLLCLFALVATIIIDFNSYQAKHQPSNSRIVSIGFEKIIYYEDAHGNEFYTFNPTLIKINTTIPKTENIIEVNVNDVSVPFIQNNSQISLNYKWLRHTYYFFIVYTLLNAYRYNTNSP